MGSINVSKIAELLKQIAFSFHNRLFKVRTEQRELLNQALKNKDERELEKIRQELNN